MKSKKVPSAHHVSSMTSWGGGYNGKAPQIMGDMF